MRILHVIVLGITLLGCSQTEGTSQETDRPVVVRKITSQELTDLKASREIQLIDVRTTAEANAGMIQDAILIDINSTDFIENIGRLDKSKPVVFYCAAGLRSEKAATQLRDLGFTEIYDLRGGIGAWQSSGNEVVYPKK